MTLCDMTVPLHQTFLTLSEPLDGEIEARVFKNLVETYTLHGITLSAVGRDGKSVTVCSAFTKKGMFLKIINVVLQQITLLTAEKNKESLLANWYFDCPFDLRKNAFEKHIQYATELFGKRKTKALIDAYTVLLNKKFVSPHWRYDGEMCAFREISHSKEI